jgi:hypothetical protein
MYNGSWFWDMLLTFTVLEIASVLHSINFHCVQQFKICEHGCLCQNQI